MLVNLCALLFILLFLLLSALSGQLGEEYNRNALMHASKLAEISIMLIGAAGFVFGSLPLMFVALLATGTHSALLGPVRYSILPQRLYEDELVGGNALMEMDTFLTILVGTIGAGVLMFYAYYTAAMVTAVVLAVVCGCLVNRGTPRTATALPELELDWNISAQPWSILRLGLGQYSVVSRPPVGNSWSWFLGTAYPTQIPTPAEGWLCGDENVVALILTVFSVDITLGPMLCEKFSGRKVEIGLVPLGLIGLTILGILLWWRTSDTLPGEAPYNWLVVLRHYGIWAVLANTLFIGVLGGFYIISSYVPIQAHTDENKRARVIAANNVLNALFMVATTLISVLFLSVAKPSIPQLFLVLSLINVMVNVHIFEIVPGFTTYFLAWLFSHTMYRVRHVNLETIPGEETAVLVRNHVSCVDMLLIADSIWRLACFVVYYRIFSLSVLNFTFRTANAAPIAARHENEEIYERVSQRITGYLKDGEPVHTFPGGKLTADGRMNELRAGIERIIEETPAPMIPMALQDLWGSFFDHDSNKGFFHRLRSWVSLVTGEPAASEAVEYPDLQVRVMSLCSETRRSIRRNERTSATPGPFLANHKLDNSYFIGLRTSSVVDNHEGNLPASLQAFEASVLDETEVNEQVVTAFRGDEARTFGVAEPFYGAVLMI